MVTKRTVVPGEADKLIAHQSRLLKAPRIAAHYHRLAEQGREANWSLEEYLAAVLAVESSARAESGLASASGMPDSPRSRRSLTSTSLLNPELIALRSPASKPAVGWLKHATSCYSARREPAKRIWPPHWRSPPPRPGTGSRLPRLPDGSPVWPKPIRSAGSMPNYAKSPESD